MTKNVPDVTFWKIKIIDKLAKFLGLIIYRIDYGFNYRNEHYTCDITCLNVNPDILKKDPDREGLAEVL